MNANQVLLPVYRTLRPIVDRCRLNTLARPIWAALWKKQSTRLIQAEQNDRMWWLDPGVALRGTDAEIETIRWLRSVVKPGMTVVDVGANVGQMTLEMALLVGPKGRVIAIEPGPGNLAVLRRHVEGNGFTDRVTIIAAACCASHGGRMELEIEGGQVDAVGSGFQLSGIGLMADRDRTVARRLKTMVLVVSLDGICRDFDVRPQVIKIDVEGAEVEVFRGATRLFSEIKPAIRFGFHPFAFDDPDKAQEAIVEMTRAAGLLPEDESQAPWGLAEINIIRPRRDA